MGALLAGLVVFAVLAILVVSAVDGERENADDMGAAMTLGVWFAYLVHADTVLTAAYLDVARLPVPRMAGFAVGGVILATGMVLFFWAGRTLVAHGDFRGLMSRQLVTRGPYQRIRHPQDTGWTLMLTGIAVAGRSPIALALVALFVVFVGRLWRADERQLADRFGLQYRGYRDRTPTSPIAAVRGRASG